MEIIAANNAHHNHTSADAASEESAPTDEAQRDVSGPAASLSDWASHESVTPPVPLSLDLEPRSRHDNNVMARLARRDGRSPGRRMDDEAIAGTVVGVILAVALMVCCIYPVVVYYIKKRRRNRLPFDCEYADYRGQPPVLHRRLSSSDLKREDGCKERGFNYQDPYVHDESRPSPPAAYNVPSSDAIGNITAQGHPYYSDFPYYYHDVIPVSVAPQQIVLKGTSEDYYCPHIPSEAFGMYPQPECEIAQPERISKRTSLRNNVRCLFRRKGTWDQTMNSPPSADDSDQEAAPVEPLDPTQVQQFFTTYETTESPTEFSPMRLDTPYDSPSCGPDSNIDTPHNDQMMEEGGPSQQTPQLRLRTSPCEPAPGTVNPMDIMPASTESERWYCTDYHLHTSPYELSGAGSNSADTPHLEHSDSCVTTFEDIAPPEYNHPSITTEHEHEHEYTTPQYGPSVGPHLAAESHLAVGREPTALTVQPFITTPQTASHATSLQGPSSTITSVFSGSPSTHDTPSPASMNSSDYGHHSASPHDGVGASLPKGGAYACDEPGCHQSFDQPHKLKHHQRYHSKDHKCPYATCGKGFGTKTHLQRHINDRHEKKKKFHCSIKGCEYSKTGGKAFPRKDNWKRHMTKIHGLDHTNLPGPVEVDHEVSGV